MDRALHVLHIDDDDELRQIVALSLALDPAITVRGASSGADALAIAGDAAQDLDVLLLDYSVGRESGVTLLAALRDLPGLSSLPVVFLTGRLREPERAAMEAAGALGVVRKPFNPLTLGEELRGLVGS